MATGGAEPRRRAAMAGVGWQRPVFSPLPSVPGEQVAGAREGAGPFENVPQVQGGHVRRTFGATSWRLIGSSDSQARIMYNSTTLRIARPRKADFQVVNAGISGVLYFRVPVPLGYTMRRIMPKFCTKCNQCPFLLVLSLEAASFPRPSPFTTFTGWSPPSLKHSWQGLRLRVLTNADIGA